MPARRSDGRRANELRPISIETRCLKFAPASVLIKGGDTHVLCAATVQEGVPEFLKGKGTGWITAEYGMLPASTPTRKSRETAKPDARGQEIRRLIGRSLRAAADLARLGERTILVDCDVLQADGGTRTLAITGAWVALTLAFQGLRAQKILRSDPLRTQIAAVSVGVVAGQCLLDLTYEEDSRADVDMNVVLTRGGRLVEIQGTAESEPFDDRTLLRLLSLAKTGCRRLMKAQTAALGPATRREAS